VQVCPECCAIVSLAARLCEECGFEFPRRELPEENAGELVEVTAVPRAIAPERGAPEAAKRAFFAHLLATEPSAAWARARYQLELRERPPAAETCR
jgi:hypothetical protein